MRSPGSQLLAGKGRGRAWEARSTTGIVVGGGVLSCLHPRKQTLFALGPAVLWSCCVAQTHSRGGGISGSRRCPSDPQKPSLFTKSVPENTTHNFFKNYKPLNTIYLQYTVYIRYDPHWSFYVVVYYKALYAQIYT